MPRQLIASDQATPFDGELKKPCSDCPFARTALPGWLGSMSLEEWVMYTHGEAKIDCHVFIGPQCAGAAIYRSNVCKSPRNKEALLLPVDTELVFASMDEFIEHHSNGIEEEDGEYDEDYEEDEEDEDY